jgi:uncharacterized protein YndB with AHSA1/START domain/predicted SnoaL-like aldol condensation-catalyzing enzyme
MTASSAARFTMPSDREVVMTRVFDAPVKLVWRAYTEPEFIPRWWGLRYLATRVDKMDLTPGGDWRFVSRAPDGSEYGFHGVFREIVPLERIVWTFEFEGLPGHVSVETVKFEEHEGKTKVTVTSLFEDKADRDGMVASGMEKGATESTERLDELLRDIGGGKDRKEMAVEFLNSIGAGRPKEGLRFFTPDCKTHNPYVSGDMDALTDAMIAVQKESASDESKSDFGLKIRHVIADGALVAVHTDLSSSKPSQGGLRQVHLFRFDGDKIVEYWDITQQVPENSPNADGAF